MIRRMQPGDLPAALKLTQAEQWSHRLEDWQFHYRLGRSWAECSDEGALLGTASWWAYGERFGTVGLVVVDRAQQGKGIGRRLMEVIVDDAGSRSLQPRSLQLIATQAGLKLYRQCGFRAAGIIEQRQGIALAEPPLPPPDGTTMREVTPNDLAALVEFDAAAFGAPRIEVISQTLTAGSGILAEHDGRLTGFALVRQSGRGTVIGPVASRSETLAMALVAQVLSSSSGFMRLDIPADAKELARWLDTAGLVRVDEVTAMLRGDRPESDAGARTFGLVSQALG